VADINRRIAAWPGLAIAGSAFGGVGIPDCVHSGETAANAVVTHLVGGGVSVELQTPSAGSQMKVTMKNMNK